MAAYNWMTARVYAVILTPEGANLNVQLVPISADNVPLMEQAQNYIFVRENLLAESAEIRLLKPQ